MRRTLITMMAMSAASAGLAALETVNDLAPYAQGGETAFWSTSAHPAPQVFRSASDGTGMTFAGAAFKASAASGIEARHRTDRVSPAVRVLRTSPRGVMINFR